ncbi:hypothetical protein AGDE_09431 [Angomonas deanei]|uniref:Uncharacterized protein n=1 Tax=Angomonas deanei TaxID=59799 RepID=A0A7G2CRC7_9TRYP|nr:hypothetical protein AGDE_09431 [Angomonas deanei]CAD2220732.1 hypothetical protein, conserved [Angomonas deanei]|eukprot:EPY30463.1 hypothetical protein AGDE_09431 [Angomonas deanei]
MNHSTNKPKGRSEYLFWLNSLCRTEYPAVESLRDCAAYCTVIEAATRRIAENCVKYDHKDAWAYAKRAEFAEKAIQKIDWKASLEVCENIDPSKDNRTVRSICRKNSLLLQDLLANSIPPNFSTDVDIERMASGKLQDHIKVLEWLFNFMTKVLDSFSDEALTNNVCAGPYGDVEGVKLTRSVKLLGRERRRKSATSFPNDESTDVTTPDSRRQVSPRHPSLRTSSTGPARQLRTAKPSRVPDSFSESKPKRTQSSRAYQSAGKTENGLVGKNDDGSRGGRESPPAADTPSALHSAEIRKISHSSPSTAFLYSRGSTAVLEIQKNTLVSLRQEVEELEALILNAHEKHQCALTESSNVVYQPREEVLPFLVNPEYTPPDNQSVGLQELGRILEERDSLYFKYLATEKIVNRYEEQKNSTTPSLLLERIQQILYPLV